MKTSLTQSLARKAVPYVFMMAAAALMVFPLMRSGNPAGKDMAFHLGSWMEVARDWRQGLVYPQWASLANFGLGEPRFIFYPPLSWLLGAKLSLALPLRLVPGTFAWLVLVFAGVTMYRLAKAWMTGSRATFAALLYILNPYSVVNIYGRSAYGELLASVFLPLVVAEVLALRQQDSLTAPRLACALSLIWLTNLPAAVMSTYVVALGILLVIVTTHCRRALITGGAAIGLAFGLSALVIIPAAVEQHWVMIQAAVAPQLSPAANFIFGANVSGFVNYAVVAEMLAVAGGMLLLCAPSIRFRPIFAAASILVAVGIRIFPDVSPKFGTLEDSTQALVSSVHLAMAAGNQRRSFVCGRGQYSAFSS